MKKKKRLSEMTLEELWQLFPIFLTEHKAYWNTWYEEELTLLESVLPLEDIRRICHIGSTAIDHIWAKPIVDILVELNPACRMEKTLNSLTAAGYVCMSQDNNRISFNKGYTENGFAEKVFHLHLRYAGDNDELYFRDYLNDNSDTAEAYEKMKLGLWKKFEHDRDGYTERKTEFVRMYTAAARKKYGARYD